MDLQTREKLKQSSKSTGLIDAEINSTLKYLGQYQILIQIMNWINWIKKLKDTRLIRIAICQQRKFRKGETYIMNQLKNDKIQKNELNQITWPIYSNIVIQEKKNNYENFGQIDALKMHGEITERQDEYLSKINDKVLNIKYSSQNLSKQIKEQNGMIDQLHEETDSANQAMNRLKNKMNYFLDNSSSWKLLIILFFEIFVFIFVVVI
ncbi:unnamed protein product (macronuclear) [Paramecium tetraurelia]|uniref:t-SNARE coiled-coil homology domain-containing protein n=1 Tax=Paramecium tetraurelia TaxID=5888 RepID=A0DZZ3_PARTE|nr:uncharacterized protein GSPATT00021778001 [Paramecium tetraurelia]CAK88610.1 unnamed protein product [Paramecium tetraurelia]|eukprot:XP_001456007.1 hypothetical protein (macronuclear) [Paramecium tetraurelia strain d4-2]